ncbi:MAG TPA: hypothetical protein VFU15_06805 [Bacteroidia bacterium]|nr:hypothetical protein [Bacteroidia bacterium]
MNRNTRRLFIVPVAVLLLVACNLFHKTQKSEADYVSQGYVKAMVTEIDLDGCKWMIRLDSTGKNLEPDELLPQFQKDSLQIWLKYKADDRMSVCMAGQTINVLDIQLRK